MAKLTRLTAKVFGETADGTLQDPEIGQFGSAKAGTYNGTGDVATIQSLSAWSNGWIDAVTPTQQFPPLPEMTGVHKVLSYQEAYLLQQGIPEWDSATTYYTNGFCSKAGKIYISQSDNNLNHDPESDTVNWQEFTSGSSRNIGEVVTSTLPLTDAGLHLLDGSQLQYGSYKDFIDYIADLYNDSTKYSNVYKVGSLTDTDGVLSGFSTSNYAKFPVNFQPSTNTWEMVFKVTTNSSPSTEQYICSFQVGDTNATRYSSRLAIRNGNFCVGVTYNGTAFDATWYGSYTVLANTTYWLKWKYTGSAYVLEYSLDGETYITDINESSTTPIYNACQYCVIGLWNNGSTLSPFLGSIDLNESYININGSRWWDGRNPSWVLNEPQWQLYNTNYGVCGKFVYDSVNNTVRLPKISNILQGTTDVTALGDLVQAGLPNITGTFNTGNTNLINTSNGTGAFSYSNITMTGTGDASNTRPAILDFNASRSSSIYGNSNTVQPQTIKVLYYIVIATSAKTEIQVDIDEIATDLNGKADVDLTNVSATGKAKISNYAMPSNTYDNLTVGADGTTYTAPADGYFCYWSTKPTAGYTALVNTTTSFHVEGRATINSTGCGCWLPARKGDIVRMNWDGTNANTMWRFYYAEGEK